MALALVVELALLCCACAHLAHHDCAHPARCPICQCVLDGLRVLAATAGLILMPFIASAAACAERACPARLSSPVSRRVRLND